MTRSIHSPGSWAITIAAGLITFFALADGGFAQTAPPVAVAFGAATEKPQAPNAAVYGVAVGGTPVAPVLTPTLLNSSPEPNPGYSFTPQVSALAFSNNTTSDLLAANSTIGHLYTLPGPSYATSSGLYNGGGECGVFATGIGVDGSGNILAAGNISCSPSVFIYQQSDGIFVSLMDSVNQDTGLAGGGNISTIADAAVAPSSFANGIQAGDLVVLVGDTYSNPNQPVVFVYPHTAVAAGLSPPLYTFPAAAKTLVTQANFPIGSNYVPVSIAISPIDGSLLIAVSDGTIWIIPPTQSGYGTPQRFATTGCFTIDCSLNWGKIAAMQQGGSLYLFATVADSAATQSSGQESGYLWLYSGPFPTDTNHNPLPYATPSASLPNAQYPLAAVQPTSVAVLQYKTGTIPASDCFNTPCDVLGDGVMTSLIDGNTAGVPAGATITQQECVVRIDPRGPYCGAGSLRGAQSLALGQVCKGLSDTRVIPNYFCTTPANPGFIVIATTADQLDDTDGVYVHTQETTTPGLGSDSGCPSDRSVLTSNDHSLTETQYADGAYFFDLTSGCVPPTPSLPDPTTKVGNHSVDIIGLQLVTSQFAGPGKSGDVGYVDFKSGKLLQTIRNANIRYAWERAVMLFGVSVAQHLVDIGHYDCAAELYYLLDQFMRRHSADFLHSAPAATVRAPNPLADISGRLGNLFFGAETDIQHKTPNQNWPLAADPHLCRTNECKLSGLDK